MSLSGSWKFDEETRTYTISGLRFADVQALMYALNTTWRELKKQMDRKARKGDWDSALVMTVTHNETATSKLQPLNTHMIEYLMGKSESQTEQVMRDHQDQDTNK